MPEPSNQKLYSYVKTLANKKFKSPSGIYRSSWIVREYKKRGGKYSGPKSSGNKSSGLKRWFKENWIDLNRPKRNSKGKIIGYHKCGRKSANSKGKYPLCRPSKHINKGSPKTYSQLSKSSIQTAKKLKKIYTYKKNINFSKKKSSTKRRSAKKLSTKHTSTKHHSTKRLLNKRRSTKKLSTKLISTKRHSTKRS